MWLHAMILILSLASLASGCTENELGEIGCEPSPNLCRVVCTSADGCALESAFFAINPTEIRTEKLTGACDTTTGEGLVDFATFDDAACRSTCKKQDETKEGTRCRFWRYDKEEDKKTCTLMSDEQCTFYSPCVEGTHPEKYNCKSGDLKCPGGSDPVPEGIACKAPIEFISDYVHWGCRDDKGHTLSAYSPTLVDLPPETICTTSAKCSDWDNLDDNLDETYRKLRVKCDGVTGSWTAEENTGGDDDDYQGVLGEDGAAAILEPACLGGGVELAVPAANIQQAGVELVCDTPVLPESEFYTIKAPNTCLLLCDHHLGMTIESVLKEDGDVVFQNEDGELSDPANVKCW